MKVAYLTTYYNGRIDGRFGRFHDWVHALRDMNDPPFDFEVIALTASNPDGTLASQPHGIFGEATELWGSPTNKLEFALNTPRALRDLRRIGADVIHVLTLDGFAYPAALAASGRSPVVGPDVQGWFPGREGDQWNRGGVAGLKQRGHHSYRRALLGIARKPTVVALSQYHAANVQTLNESATVEVVPPGVSSVFNPGEGVESSDRATEYLYLGDLSEYKGYDLFLDALSQLPDDVDFRATVVGSGDPQRDRISDMGLADRVDVEGFVHRSDLPQYYRRADCYVMPSVDEHGPNTIVEALACGTPVVATDRAGINEYAQDDAAVYVERTPSALRRGMIAIHRNRGEYRRAAMDRAPEYSASRTVEALADVYEGHRQRN